MSRQIRLRKFRLFSWSICFFACALKVQAASAQGDPLAEIVKLGVTNAFDVQSQKLRLEKSVNQVSINRAALLPTVTLSSSKTYGGGETLDSTTGGLGYSVTPSSGLSVTANWALWNNYANIRSLQVAKKDLEADRVTSSGTVQSFILSLVTAYLDYQLVLSARDILVSRLEQSRLTNEESQALVKAGAKTALDAMDTEIDVMKNESDLVDADNKITKALRGLQILINNDNLKSLPRLDLLKHEPYYTIGFAQKLATIRASWQKQVEEQNLDLRANRLSLESAQLTLAQTRMSRWPATSISLSHSYNMDRYLQDDPTGGRRIGLQSSSISFQLEWKLWDWLSTPYSIANSEKDYENALIVYRKKNLTAQADFESQLKEFDLLEKTLEASRRVVQKAEAQYEFSQEMYRLGRLTRLEIQQATSRLSDTRNALAERLRNRSVLIANLMYASGYELTPPGFDLPWIR